MIPSYFHNSRHHYLLSSRSLITQLLGFTNLPASIKLRMSLAEGPSVFASKTFSANIGSHRKSKDSSRNKSTRCNTQRVRMIKWFNFPLKLCMINPIGILVEYTYKATKPNVDRLWASIKPFHKWLRRFIVWCKVKEAKANHIHLWSPVCKQKRCIRSDLSISKQKDKNDTRRI